VASFATHDHKPIRALWDEVQKPGSPTAEQARQDLLKIAEFAGVEPREGLDYYAEFYPAIMRALFQSNAWIGLATITDLLALRDRFNVPGTAASSNWSRRMQKTVKGIQASPAIQKRIRVIRELLETTGRIS